METWNFKSSFKWIWIDSGLSTIAKIQMCRHGENQISVQPLLLPAAAEMLEPSAWARAATKSAIKETFI
jgi:hypothetical protein